MTHILVVHPIDPALGIEDVDAFVQDLTRIGLLDQELERRQRLDSGFEYTYSQGQRFLELVEYDHSHLVDTIRETDDGLKRVPLGDSQHLARVSLVVYDEARFLGTANTLLPICPYCQHETEDPFKIVGDWLTNQTEFTWCCSKCGRDLQIQEMNWQHSSGFGRIAIYVWDVWQGEAKPSGNLLNSLEEVAGGKWAHFYYHS